MEPLAAAAGLQGFINTLRIKAKVLIGHALNLFAAPGFIRPVEQYYRSINKTIKVEVTELFTIISIDGIDWYFYRLNGKLDGWGTSWGPNKFQGMQPPEIEAIKAMAREEREDGE